jgi:hypothetical protein
MKIALHPLEPRRISPREYIAEFGSKFDRIDDNERARCPACKHRLSTPGEDRAGLITTFRHLPNKDHWCIFKNASDFRYRLLPNSNLDPIRGAQLRESFLQNWQKHFILMDWYAAYFDIVDFVERIQLADKEQLWSRPKLQEWEVPHILLVWQAVPPAYKKTGEVLRAEWLRFWFDGRIRTIDDLWIRTEGDFLLTRACYNTDRNAKRPDADDLVDVGVEPINRAFLNCHFEPVTDKFKLKHMKNAFNH